MAGITLARVLLMSGLTSETILEKIRSGSIRLDETDAMELVRYERAARKERVKDRRNHTH
jgi:hypothetical protein